MSAITLESLILGAMGSMTVEQLQSFIAAVENDTFFDAAEAMHISQSALSKQVQKLEKELNVQLLERSHRTTVPTAAGQLVFQHAKAIAKQHQTMLAQLEELRAEDRIKIGALPILSQYSLTEQLQAFIIRYPEIQIDIDEVEEDALVEGLEKGRYDFIIARESMVKTELVFTEIAKDELVVILPEEHILAKQEQIDIETLAEFPLFLMNPYTAVYHLCKVLFEENAVNPRIVRTGRVESILSAVSVQRSLSLLPYRSFQVFQHNGLTARPLKPIVELSVVLAGKRKRMSAAQQSFLAFWKGANRK